MSQKSLMKLANKFENKLGLSGQTVKTSEVTLPKSLRKLAQAEQHLHQKIAEHRQEFNKVAAGPTVRYSQGTLPALYHVCQICQGLGKLAESHSVPNVKFASTEEYLGYLKVEKCSGCKGKKIVKAVDDSQCSEDQLLAYAAEEADKEEKKKNKKTMKAAKKLSKLERKAQEKKMALEDPEGLAKMKAEKKGLKNKKKMVKKAKKANKKLEKFKSKKGFPFFAKKEKSEE